MFEIYNDYITESVTDINLEQLYLALDSVIAQREIAIQEACLDVDNSEVLLEEVNTKAEEREKSIFKKIWEAIIEFFKSVKNKLVDIFSKKEKQINLNASYDVPVSMIEEYHGIMKFWKNLDQGFNKMRNGNQREGFVQFVKGLSVPVVAVGAGLAGAKVVKKIKGSQLKKMQDDMKDANEDMIKKSEASKDESGDGVRGFTGKLKEFGGSIKSWCHKSSSVVLTDE